MVRFLSACLDVLKLGLTSRSAGPIWAVAALVAVGLALPSAGEAYRPAGAGPLHGLRLAHPDRSRALQAEITGTITPDGTPFTKTISTAGDTITLTFFDTPGNYISLSMSGSFYTYTKVRIFDPNGQQIASANWGAGLIDKTYLADPGLSDKPYKITVTPLSSVPKGTGTFRLWNVPADDSGTMAVDGPAETVTISTPGQNAWRTFEGEKDQFISLKLGGGFSYYVKLKICQGQVLPCTTATTVASVNFGQTYVDRVQLVDGGIYTIYLDPSGTTGGETGSTTLQLTSVLPDDTGTIDIGGNSQVLRVSSYGQRSERLFYGFAGQQVTLALQNVSIYYYTPIRILDPSGVSIASKNAGAGGTLSAGLSTNGAYKVWMDPQGAFTGSVTVALTGSPGFRVTITGRPQVGQVLTASLDIVSAPVDSWRYQWQRCDAAGGACVDIAGESFSTHTVHVGRIHLLGRLARGIATHTSYPGAKVLASRAGASESHRAPSKSRGHLFLTFARDVSESEL
jgi:hypothetical protein